MNTNHRSMVPAALGLLLLAAGASDGQELLMRVQDDDWWLFSRAELECVGGLWLLGGTTPRWAWISTAIAVFGISTCDLLRAVAGYPPRDGFGRVSVGTGWILVGDLFIVLALWRWRRSADSAPRIRSRPALAIGAAAIAIGIGVAINWSQIGRFPIVATAGSAGASSSVGLDYLVYLPVGYGRSAERWPLILYLHGAGAVGHDPGRVRAGGLPRYFESGGRVPFLVVAPQSPRYGWDVEALDALLDEVLHQYRVDVARVYLTGASMGGYGAWGLAAAHPARFAALAPICGGGDPASAVRLRDIPTWAFHGAEDSVVPPQESWVMVRALEQVGGDVKLTIYPGVGHDSAARTYADSSLYEWFLAHRRRPDQAKINDVTTPSFLTCEWTIRSR